MRDVFTGWRMRIYYDHTMSVTWGCTVHCVCLSAVWDEYIGLISLARMIGQMCTSKTRMIASPPIAPPLFHTWLGWCALCVVWVKYTDLVSVSNQLLHM